MTQKLSDPLGMLNQPKVETAAAMETARMDNMRIGVCPVCAGSMKKLMAADILSYVCLDDNVSLPCEDAATPPTI